MKLGIIAQGRLFVLYTFSRAEGLDKRVQWQWDYSTDHGKWNSWPSDQRHRSLIHIAIHHPLSCLLRHVILHPTGETVSSFLSYPHIFLFVSAALLYFSDQKWNSQNYLSSLHITESLMHIIKAISHSFGKIADALAQSCKWLHAIVFLFPTLSIAYVVLIKMYYTSSLSNSLTPQNIYALFHCISHAIIEPVVIICQAHSLYNGQLMNCSQLNLEFHQ